MATQKQIAANRANSKRSTGPKTAAGKLRSSRNAFRHGLSLTLPYDPLIGNVADALARTSITDPDQEAMYASGVGRSLIPIGLFGLPSLERKRVGDPT